MSAVAVLPSQASLRDELRDFIREEIEPIAADHDRSGVVPAHLVQRFFDRGFTTRLLDAPDSSFVSDACVACDELAYSSAAIASLLVLPVFFGRLALRLLPEPTREELRERCQRGPVVVAFAASEHEAGSDPLATTVRAERVGEYFVLRGSKAYSSNLRQASLAIVLARTGPEQSRAADGFTWFLADLADPAITVGERWPTLGLRAMDLSPLELRGSEVPAGNVLGREGQGLTLMADSLVQSRTGVAAVALGIARRARDEALLFGRERKIYGERLLRLQDYRFSVATIEMDVAAARALIDEAATRLDRGEPSMRTTSVAKLYAGQMAMRVTETVLRLMGARGYTGQGIAERLFRDARHVAIVEGSEPIHKELIFSSLLRHGGA